MWRIEGYRMMMMAVAVVMIKSLSCELMPASIIV